MPNSATIVVTLMMLPWPRAAIRGAIAAVRRNGALTLTAKASSKAGSGSSCVGPPGKTPALLTRMSTSATRPASARTSSAEARSARTNSALAPASSIAATASTPRCSLLPVITTGASRSQLYHYFNDRDDLVRAVVDVTTDAVLDVQGELLGRLDSWAAIDRW